MTSSQQWPTGRHAPTSAQPAGTSGPASAGYTYPAQQPQIPQQWTPPGAYPTQQTPQPPPRKRRKWPFIVGGIIALLVVVGLVNGGGTPSTTPTAAAPAAAPVPAGPSQAEIDEARRQLDDINRQLEDRKAELSSMPTVAPAVPAAPVAPVAPVEPAPVASGPATTVSDGTYQVGTDMTPGRYKTAGPDGSGALDMCYVSRNKDDSGEFDAIIANQIVEGPGSVTVNDGEFAEFSGGCTWTKQ